MKTLMTPRTGLLASMIITAGTWRPYADGCHAPSTNFTPVGAMALFGGCYFAERWKAFFFPLLTLWISDILLSYFIYFHEWRLFYDGFFVTYGSFALMVVMGTFMKQVNIKNVLMASVIAALSHWIITDFAVWLDGRLYPKTLEGLITCYTIAIPYMKNMLLGNLLFSAIMFGAFEFAQKKYPVLNHAH